MAFRATRETTTLASTSQLPNFNKKIQKKYYAQVFFFIKYKKIQSLYD